MRVGIDASNTGSGGVLTHLSQVLSASEPERFGIDQVMVWGSRATLAQLPDRPWLEKVAVGALARSLPVRLAWQQLRLSRQVRLAHCTVLFCPGGIVPFGSGTPCVSVSQNLLPFETDEPARLGFTWRRLKLALIRSAQRRSFAGSRGLIFLTDYGRRKVLDAIGPVRAETAVIPHGIEPRFFFPPSPSRTAGQHAGVFRLLYASRIDVYKHQWVVAEAAAGLRRRGFPVELTFVGPAYGPALARLRAAMRRLDPDNAFLRYRGVIPFNEIHEIYRQADVFVLASSCESFSNTLVEAMATGLPIACSRAGPLPAILGDAGVYFDPADATQVESALARLLENADLRTALAARAFERARAYSWQHCADETLACIARWTR